jgi:hypothetical protein
MADKNERKKEVLTKEEREEYGLVGYKVRGVRRFNLSDGTEMVEITYRPKWPRIPHRRGFRFESTEY